MVRENPNETGKELIAEMREAFRIGDLQKTLSVFEEFGALKANRALRLEAECLTVRALAAVGHRNAARRRMKELNIADFRKAVHYEFLARAYLDLKQYKSAAEACERAESLRVQEAVKGKAES